MSNDSVLFEVRDNVAHVTLNRPQAGNALDLEMAKQLMAVALRCEADPGVRAVLLKGAGKSFCAGGDVKVFVAQKELPALSARNYFLSASGDLALCAAGCTGHRSSTGIGSRRRFQPGDFLRSGGCRRVGEFSDGLLEDRHGAGRRLDIFSSSTGGTQARDGADADQSRAVSAGSVRLGNRDGSCCAGKSGARAEELARSLAQGPTGAFGSAKRLLHGGWNQTLETQMELESRAIAEAGGTADGQEGIRAFVEKRKAKFGGK